jgi:hypothetical protein
MEPLLNNAALAKYRDNSEIIRKTALQVIKDFNQFGLDVDFPDDLQYAYPVLFNQLLLHVTEMMNSDIRKLYALLYRIDIHENTIRKKTEEQSEKELTEIITILILERELKKVILRDYFSKL